MHVISADTTVADTIWYDTPSIGSDTIPDPIIIRSLLQGPAPEAKALISKAKAAI